MWSVYRLFMTQELKNVAYSMAVQAVLLIGADRLGIGTVEIYPLIAFVGVMGGLLGPAMVSRNLNWVLPLPISKSRVIGLNMATVLSSIAIHVAATAGVALAYFGFYRDMPKAFELLKTGILYLALSPFMVATLDVSVNVIALYLGALNLMIATGYLVRRSARKPGAFLKENRKAFACIILGVFAIQLSQSNQGPIADFFDNGFMVFTGLLLALYVGFAQKSLKEIGMHAVQRRKWVLGGGALAALQVGFVIAGGASHIRGGDTEMALDAIQFFGKPGVLFVAEPKFAALLEKSEDLPKRSDLFKLYLGHYHQGRKIDAKKPGASLSFDKFARNKLTQVGLDSGFQLFEPRSLGMEQLTTYLDRLDAVQGRNGFWHATFAIPLAPEHVAALIRSDKKTTLKYGLIRARYERHSSIHSVLRHRLSEIPDSLKSEAMLTYSILQGRYTDSRELESRGRGLASMIAEPDCSAFRPERLGSLSPAEEPALNICARKRVIERSPSWIGSLESQGWIRIPLDASSDRLVRRFFKD